jgi:hypothetical protein
MKIQATIAGFKGERKTVLGNLVERTGVLIMAREVKYTEKRLAPDIAIVSNLDLADIDFRFTDKHIGEAIRVYYTRKAHLTLDVLNEIQNFDPGNMIEPDAVDEGGRRYRISPDITNGQVSVLAAVAFVEHQTGFKEAIGMANELSEFYRVQSF